MNLKACRVNKHLTQAEAAKLIGVSVGTLKAWEKRVRFPKQPQIMKICEVYGVDYDTIIF